jgi:hypothetical protein
VDRVDFVDSLKLIGGFDLLARLLEEEKTAKEAAMPASYTKTVLKPIDDDRKMYEWRALYDVNNDQFFEVQREGFDFVGEQLLKGNSRICFFRRERTIAGHDSHVRSSAPAKRMHIG